MIPCLLKFLILFVIYLTIAGSAEVVDIAKAVKPEIDIISKAVICAEGSNSCRLGAEALKCYYRRNAQQVSSDNAGSAEVTEKSYCFVVPRNSVVYLPMS